MSVQPDFGTQVPGSYGAEDPYAISQKWHAHKDYKKPFDYTVENSGQRLLLQRLEMPDLLKQGIANEMDFMTKGLMSSDKTQKPKEAVSEVIAMADNFTRMESMVNKVCLAGVLKPKIHPVPVVVSTENGKTTETPIEMEKRQQGLFYVDNIPWDDRQELFSVIFETEGLSDFREKQVDGVGNVADVQDVPLPADGSVPELPSDNPQGVLPE